MRRLIPVLALVAAAAAALPVWSDEGTPPTAKPTRPRALVKTSMGDFTLELFADEAPKTVQNFLELAEGTKLWKDPMTGEERRKPFFDGLGFHRIIDGFMIQGGCPLGNGMGGPGYKCQDECTPALKHDRPGILSMANAGPRTNGSQFFITHVPTNWLDGKHTVFGAVIGKEDQAVVNSIAQNDRIESITVSGDTDALFAQTKSHLDEWNSILDKRFPKK